VDVEDAPLDRRGVDEVLVREGGLGKAHAAWVEAVGALVDRHSPARVVILGLTDQRVYRLDQLVPDRDRLRGYAAENAAHDPSNLTALEGANRLRSFLLVHMELVVQEPRRIWWARPRKLCALERPGGGGRNHRADRRAAEIEYLRGRGVRMVVSVMRTRHNLSQYEAAGLDWHHVPVRRPQDEPD